MFFDPRSFSDREELHNRKVLVTRTMVQSSDYSPVQYIHVYHGSNLGMSKVNGRLAAYPISSVIELKKQRAPCRLAQRLVLGCTSGRRPSVGYIDYMVY